MEAGSVRAAATEADSHARFMDITPAQMGVNGLLELF
jgi:hypothetical protein